MRKVLLALLCSSGIWVAPPALAIYYGTLTDGFEHTGCFTSGSNCFATGTLVSSEWVLTAGHVSLAPGSSLFETSFGNAVVVAKYDAPNSWITGWDVALVRLASPLDPGSFPILSSQTLIGDAMLGEQALSVGYGWTENFVDDNMKRYGFSTIIAFDQSVGGGGNIPYASFMSSPILLGPGDSGGGTYIDFGDGYVLAGINSRVTSDVRESPGSIGGTGNVFVDTASVRGWLDSFDAGIQWGTAGHDYLVRAVPEPSVLMLMTIGLAALGFASRRRPSCWR